MGLGIVVFRHELSVSCSRTMPELDGLEATRQIAPADVLARQPQDQLAHLTVDRRSTGPTARVRPVSSDPLPMPAQQSRAAP
jgi:hypothetical protein